VAKVNLRSLAIGALFLILAQHGSSADVLGRVRVSGVLNIGYRVDARPFSYRAPNGRPAGYIVELCQEVAAAVKDSVNGGKFEIHYVEVNAQNRFAALQDGSVDMVCDSSSITMGRRATVDFSLPTFVDGVGLLYRGRDDFRGFESLGGKRVGVVASTTTEPLLRNALSGLGVKADISTVNDYAAGLDRLLDQTLDAFLGDRSILASLLKDRGQGSGLRLSRSYFSYEVYALMLPKNEEPFRLLVDKTLASLYRKGRVQALLEKTFGNIQDDVVLQNLIIINSIPD
jgi:ABC-type amino acid transport substrate-binding protein